MESSTPTRVLVVAHKTAATPALLEAVRERADAGRARSRCWCPTPPTACTSVVDPEDQDESEAEEVLELALPLLEDAAGGPVDGLIGDPEPLDAIQDAVNLQRLRRDHHLDAAHAGVALAASSTCRPSSRASGCR